jgi:glutamyl-tRNA synthetase
MIGHMAALTAALGGISPFDESHVEAVVRGTAAERGIKAGALIHAVRVALTGRTASPGLFEIVALLGREETTARMKALLTFLANRN